MDEPNEGGNIRTFPDTERTRFDIVEPGQPEGDDMTCDRCGAQFDDQKALQDHVHSHEAMTERRAA